ASRSRSSARERQGRRPRRWTFRPRSRCGVGSAPGTARPARASALGGGGRTVTGRRRSDEPPSRGGSWGPPEWPRGEGTPEGVPPSPPARRAGGDRSLWGAPPLGSSGGAERQPRERHEPARPDLGPPAGAVPPPFDLDPLTPPPLVPPALEDAGLWDEEPWNLPETPWTEEPRTGPHPGSLEGVRGEGARPGWSASWSDTQGGVVPVGDDTLGRVDDSRGSWSPGAAGDTGGRRARRTPETSAPGAPPGPPDAGVGGASSWREGGPGLETSWDWSKPAFPGGS